MRPTFLALGCVMLLVTPASADMRPRPAPSKSATVSAPGVSEAQQRFKRALDLYEEGSLDAARVELRRAYDLAPTYKLLYNLGQVEFELHDYPAALADFQQFLDMGGSDVTPERKAQVQKDIDRLRARVATLTIAVDVASAEVFVDDQLVGTSPLGKPLTVSAGRRELSVVKNGFVTAKRIVDLAGGDTSELEMHLSRVDGVLSSGESERGTGLTPAGLPSRTSASRAGVPWIGWAVTGVLVAGATTSGVLALDASRKLRLERDTLGVTRGTLDAQEKRVVLWATVTDIVSGAAVVAAGLSLYSTLTRRPPPRDEPAALQFVPTLGGLRLEGAF